MYKHENALVSVVVPVYNVEKYIARCIESILSQTYENLELILVDDGSSDQSGAICDEYAHKDNRVTVIHQKNAGVSRARNAGIDQAKGEFLFFVDSDDWVEPEHIQTLLPIDGENMVYGGRKFFVNGLFTGVLTIPTVLLYREEWLSGYDTVHSRGLTLTFINACYDMKLIRTHNLQFNTELDISEDGMFNLEYMKYCSKIRYTDKCTYCYEDGDVTSSSLSHKYQPKRLLAEILKCKKTEEVTGHLEYSIRWYLWKGVVRHYRKWLTFNCGERKGEASEMLKQTYANRYFRECLPYMRKYGTLDEKIETFFMRRWLHPLYEPMYSVVVFLSKIKNYLLRK